LLGHLAPKSGSTQAIMLRTASLFVLAILVAAALAQDLDENGRFIAKKPVKEAEEVAGNIWDDLAEWYGSGSDNKIALVIVELLGLGFFGLDRILIGAWQTGLIKLVTGGGCGIWFLVDYCIVMFNCVKGDDSIDILWMDKTFSPDTVYPTQWIAIVGLLITFCCPGVFSCIFGVGCLGSLPFVGRFFRKEPEPVVEHHHLIERPHFACCGMA